MKRIRYIIVYLLLLLPMGVAAQDDILRLDVFRDEGLLLLDGAQERQKGVEVQVDGLLQENKVSVRKFPKCHFGVTAGYRHSGNDWGVEIDDVLYRRDNQITTSPGVFVGAVASLPIDDVLSFDTGLGFSLWGFGHRTSDYQAKYSRYVMEIPLMITFFEPDALVPIFVQTGVNLGLTLGGEQRFTQLEVGIDLPPVVGRAFSRFTVGVVAAIGYGPVSVQFISNFTETMSKEFCRKWEQEQGSVLAQHDAWSVMIAYTYWF